MELIIDNRAFLIACANKCMGCVEATKQAGVSNCVLHRIKHGKCVHAETVGKLAKVLDVKPIDLLKEDGNEQK